MLAGLAVVAVVSAAVGDVVVFADV